MVLIYNPNGMKHFDDAYISILSKL